ERDRDVTDRAGAPMERDRLLVKLARVVPPLLVQRDIAQVGERYADAMVITELLREREAVLEEVPRGRVVAAIVREHRRTVQRLVARERRDVSRQCEHGLERPQPLFRMSVDEPEAAQRGREADRRRSV